MGCQAQWLPDHLILIILIILIIIIITVHEQMWYVLSYSACVSLLPNQVISIETEPQYNYGSKAEQLLPQ